MSHDCDLALLGVDGAEFMEDIEPPEIGELPSPVVPTEIPLGPDRKPARPAR